MVKYDNAGIVFENMIILRKLQITSEVLEWWYRWEKFVFLHLPG